MICFLDHRDIHGGEVMRMNICVAIIVMMMSFLIGANVEAEKVRHLV